MRRLAAIASAFFVAGCTAQADLPPQRLARPVLASGSRFDPRVNGALGATDLPPTPGVSYATPAAVTLPANAPGATGGDVSLNFTDTDIRQIVAQILGSILKLNYSIDPAVHGSGTLHTVTPVARIQLPQILQALLAQNGAALVQSGSFYQVVPTKVAAATTSLSAGDAMAGGGVLPLRYASAPDLARVLQPFVGQDAKVVADPSSNSLLISGSSEARETLGALAKAFDIDELAGQSYILLPAPQGSTNDFAISFQDALRARGSGLANVVRVVPMERIGSVLVVASQPQLIEEARRVYDLIERQQRLTVRSWHVFYLQDTKANDAAYVLQQAFTPNNVTAVPSENTPNQDASGSGASAHAGVGTGTGSGSGGGAGTTSNGLNGLAGSSGIGGGNPLTAGGGGGIMGSSGASPTDSGSSSNGGGTPTATASNPLLGGLDSGGGTTDTNTLRIIPDTQNNSVFTYATQQEEEAIDAMLHKIDILPLQVRIDATIAEVTLNNQLQYGTQFFFRSGGVNAILDTTAATEPLGAIPRNTILATTFPGFILAGNGGGGAPIALQALQAVTTVHVLSSPELLVLDNQTAHLQVGDLVPYLTSSSQSTLANSSVINSVNYQPTGVIMNVTPRVNSGGLVTLDISQEVSAINTAIPTSATGIMSPTFSERNVTSRVVVQDGQTVGLAGLITDNLSKSSSGIPFLKDIPILGLLAGTQNNQRTRTELLVLITPHVLYDQQDAQALTADLQDQLRDAAGVPAELNGLDTPGLDDPQQRIRRALRTGP
ncbi:type II secretion system secretin GspD [Acidisoma sp. S159]|uniref:type II secretion system secretin GspD n=1 Tax=Acidisoma sp. S159 TaxID=1747225 RepID=UPI001577680F|nr:type II secretion system secretin GspD [Acidisoma sp. S159]